MYRNFVPKEPPILADPKEELLASLTRINTFNPPVQTCSTGWRFSGLYSGPTSVAYLFYRLAQLYPDLTFKSQSLSDWAASYLELGSSYITSGRHGREPVDPDHCGVANETLSQLAVRAALLEDASLAQQLCSYSTAINAQPNGSDEWLYGRAGYLYLLRLVRFAFPASSHSSLIDTISKTIATTITRILASPQPWIWHGKPYIGAVHGSIGIITQILLSSATPNQHAEQLGSRIHAILDLQLESGNFPSSSLPEKTTSDRLVQFCHGAPGIVISLTSLAPYYPSATSDLSTRIEQAISSAQPVLEARGLLTKPPCLCHGIASNAMALASDDDNRFLEFLSHMGSDLLEARMSWMAEAGRNDAFVGLYAGEAGRAWMWGMADQARNHGRARQEVGLIGYNDI
ncbi:uncharacterized protein HMPREF1541_02013 [Cyphellophora europaea CBS 101466]|uniref:Lanthionine synthetase C-like protein n=1 Tax=Cyphellophora europaea (strain CBS 101466) TaxID=1220924 RepID=W2S2N4_CYPE1|nr:uncharacterized protein HMPREF1541_02013 [Cyphellophora europaea CBS 101466]ETN42855.1 hypothetical protein HMPREF1541_02013 [Cyphellophora europaea CBS 101466]